MISHKCIGCGVEFVSDRRNRKFHSVRCRAIHREYPARPLALRMADLVDKKGPNDCWNFKGNTPGFGHGIITVHEGRGRNHAYRAHRIAWELANGPIPKGMCVCHRCDNPACCNPAHLFLGTVGDNNRDRHIKGRTVLPRGEQHGNAKITADDVREIRRRSAAGESFSALGRAFGVDYSNVSLIVRRKAWAHVA